MNCVSYWGLNGGAVARRATVGTKWNFVGYRRGSQVQLGNEGYRSRFAAFTLLEMIITMAIFVLLAAAVFGIVTGILHSVSTLQDNQDHRDQVAALNAFIKKKLIELPAESVLISYRRGDGDGLNQNGVIFGENGNETAIDAQVQPNGYYTLRLTHFIAPVTQGTDPTQQFLQAIQSGDVSLNWVPLIKDVQHLAWKFQDLNATQWVDLWNNATTKPNLVELSLQPAGMLQPVAMDFWIPQLVTVTLVIPESSGATTNGASSGTGSSNSNSANPASSSTSAAASSSANGTANKSNSANAPY